jgi:Sortase domain
VIRVKAFAALAALCLLASVGSAVEAWRSTTGDRHLVPARVPHTASAPVPVATTRPASTRPAPAVPTSVAPPVMVSIPAVGLSARVVPVGLTGTGQMQMPDPSVAGWYRLGPAPGAVGPSVLVGHVDTLRGPGVFYRLTAVHAGDEVVVVRADGSQARFVISGVTVVNKTAFPTSAVFGPTPAAALRLITCTGEFDPSIHHYLDSLIAWGVTAA